MTRRSWIVSGRRVCVPCAAALVTCLFSFSRPADAQPLSIDSCARIEDEAVRLACFDALAEQTRGADTPDSEDTAPDVLDVVITEVGTTVNGTAVFATEDGQIWLQISTRTRSYPDVPFEARIETGSVGSHFLLVPGGGPAVRVSRRR